MIRRFLTPALLLASLLIGGVTWAGDVRGARIAHFTTAQVDTPWVVPAGFTSIVVHARGAGGGSGAGVNNLFSGDGGGSYVGTALSVTPGESPLITVGGGGTGGNSERRGGGGYAEIETSSIKRAVAR